MTVASLVLGTPLYTEQLMLEMDRPMCYAELRVRLHVINFTKLCADRVYLDFRLASVEAFTTIEAWQRIKHPNIISVTLLAAQTSSVNPVRMKTPPGRGRTGSLVGKVSKGIRPRASGTKGTSRRRVNEEQVGRRRGCGS